MNMKIKIKIKIKIKNGARPWPSPASGSGLAPRWILNFADKFMPAGNPASALQLDVHGSGAYRGASPFPPSPLLPVCWQWTLISKMRQYRRRP
ncbi:hypothetical protein U9R80_10145 [Pseudomonas sp. JQ170C]|uniref:hypothetical protein n=1 Tax=Pseudomonas sp. JQ170C TaxID=3110111 RepID=UPI002D7656D0|nr:hypothetical protein [Pseudomonas sp. 170C]WRO78004.1 hypothetical protein U9R80_10145 [Pseudomonas sp. 170C]